MSASDRIKQKRDDSSNQRSEKAESNHLNQSIFNSDPITQAVKAKPGLSSQAGIMQLSRTIGNKAVGRLIQAKISKMDNEGTSTETKPNKTGLPDGIKQAMESTFQADFSGVRIHTNSSSAVKLNALAYTQGHDIHFAPGQFSPNSSAGKHLIGHELTHVQQQRQGRVKPTSIVGGMHVNNDPSLEREADNFSISNTLSSNYNQDLHPVFQSSVSTSSSTAIQGYFTRNDFRISDDARLAVRQEHGLFGGHEAWAEPGAANRSNNARPHSRVTLHETGNSFRFYNNNRSESHDLVRIYARNQNIGNISGGPNQVMRLIADCGESSARVAGVLPNTRRAVYNTNRVTSQAYPFQAKYEIMSAIFQDLLQSLNTDIEGLNTRHGTLTNRLANNRTQVGRLLNDRTVFIDRCFQAENWRNRNRNIAQDLQGDYVYLNRIRNNYESRLDDIQKDLEFYQHRYRTGLFDEHYTRRYLEQRIRECLEELDRVRQQRTNFLQSNGSHLPATNRQVLDRYETARREENLAAENMNHYNGIIRNIENQIDDLNRNIDQDNLELRRVNDEYRFRNSYRTLVFNTITTATNLAVLGRDPWEPKSEVYVRVFYALPMDWQNDYKRRFGIDEYADPEIGEAFAISRGGAMINNRLGCNFHWGAVVFKSGRDKVTLENDVTTTPPQGNDGWRFQMYGVGDQSFMGQQLYVGRGEYQRTPTTMRFR